MLQKIIFVILAFDLFLVAVFFIFLINIRYLNSKDRKNRRLLLKLRYAALYNSSSESAAQKLHMTPEEFAQYCNEYQIEPPEERQERLKKKLDEVEKEGIALEEEEIAWIRELKEDAEGSTDREISANMETNEKPSL